MSTLRRISLAVFLSFPPSCSGLLKVHFKRPVSGTPNITYFMDKFLPFGLRSSPALFNRLADAHKPPDRASIAPGTCRTYSSGLTAFEGFCSKFHMIPFPASARTLELFVAHLSRQGRHAATIKVYLAAVRNQHVQLRLPTNPFSDERISSALAGQERIEASADVTPARRERHAASMEDLKHIKEELFTSVTIGAADRPMLWATVTLGFFGFLRGSEYLSPARGKYHRQRTLQHRHLESQCDRLVVRIPASKTDQLCKGALVTIFPSGSDVCAVAAMQAYLLGTSRQQHDPVFAYSDGGLLMVADFNRWLKQWCGEGISSHSLRIGATTAAARAGLPSWQLQSCGRWHSDVYRRYIRQEADWSNCVSRRLAGY